MVVSAREWNVCGRVRERGSHSNAGVCVGGCGRKIFKCVGER